MQRPWMPIYWGNYFGDTSHLSTLQHGAYLLLIAHYWTSGSLPDDDQQLANITKLPLADWRKNRKTLQAFFFDGWRHKRVEYELKRHMEIYAKRVEAGQKGVIVRAMNRHRRR